MPAVTPTNHPPGPEPVGTASAVDGGTATAGGGSGRTAAPRKRPGPRRALSERVILDAALDLVDAGGADALSVRAVATAVGVAPNALYTYFGDKAELTRALVDDLLGRLDLDTFEARADGDWHTRVGTFALALRELLLAHPGVVVLLMRSAFDGPHALAGGEVLLGMLTDAGLDDADASRASYLLLTYILGTVALDVAELPPGQPRPDDPTRIRARRHALDAVPADRYPRTAATTDVIAAYNSTRQYRWGLGRILDGITAPARSENHQG